VGLSFFTTCFSHIAPISLIIFNDILDNIYNLGESAIFSKEKRQKNPVLLERTSTQELLKLAGFNTMTYDKKAQLEKALSEELRRSKKDKIAN